MKLSPLTDWNQDCLRAVLVTLQQHERLEAEIAEMEAGYKNAAELVLTYHGKNERLEAVVKAARRWHREEWSSWPADKIREGRRHTADELDADDAGMALIDALAALDTAAPDPKGEIDAVV